MNQTGNLTGFAVCRSTGGEITRSSSQNMHPTDQIPKVCFTLESTLPNSVTLTLAAACISFVTAVGATLLAAAMIFFGLKRHDSERRFCVIVSITLASIVSGVLYFDKYWSLTHKPEQRPKDDVLALVMTTTTTGQPPPTQHLVFVSPGLCETLQFLQELAFCSVIIWLASECLQLIKAASFRTPTYQHYYRQETNFCVWLVPGIMYPLTFAGLWLVFKMVHRETWLGCFERNDYDLATSIPNSFVSAISCFFAFCLVIVFCLPRYLRHGSVRFAPCFVSWISIQPLQVLTLLQTFNYVSRKYDFYYGEPHDMAYQILHVCYGLWIVAMYSLVLICDWRYSRRSMHFIL